MRVLCRTCKEGGRSLPAAIQIRRHSTHNWAPILLRVCLQSPPCFLSLNLAEYKPKPHFSISAAMEMDKTSEMQSIMTGMNCRFYEREYPEIEVCACVFALSPGTIHMQCAPRYGHALHV